MLTDKQKRFVAAYDGNALEAMHKAGYAKSTHTAYRVLRNPEVAAAIRARDEQIMSPLIAKREERQAFWTSVMKDENAEMKDRLKASELLGKSEGDFLDKVEHSGGVSLAGLFQLAKAQVGA